MGVFEPMTKSTYIEVAGVLEVTENLIDRKFVLIPAIGERYDLVVNSGDQLRAKALDGKTVIILGHLTPGRVIRVDSIQR